ncbi:efflux RND transporter periplasmic adaptor subunit [Desulfopila aestuarii]|uniref:Membrane fusion protein, multidrug efflux system n=1 Tax=Desulfopila aestuarii DSM 18488 TaxID=1121416 RepID=A0A1M7XVL5_9BACT|nr:efflux RND transporter periplasmic adaptor subunit [Desulfopila aestuarii]SHO42668.1 membrane fusion protein, multidrug efflux system [Desulfopila aestuarii DSM 18488]
MKIERNSGGRAVSMLMLGGIILAAMVLAGCEKKQEVKAPPPPAEVNVITVTPKVIPVEASFVAQVESAHQVEIVARVNGFLEKILYYEGDVVKQGQTMFQMDQKPFLAQVEAAKGSLANNKAQLWTAQANLKRVEPLAKLDAASKSDLDNAIGSVQSAEAAVHQASARLEQAELDLSYTIIKSPVTGVSGESKAREGAYLSVGPGGDLSYVAQLDPVWVTFSVSQNQLSKSRTDVAAGRIVAPANHEYTVEVHLSDGGIYPHKGKVSFIDPTFNRETGTFLIKAELPNPDSLLRPGMFVKAVLQGATRPDSLTVPQRAVQQTSNGQVVFVVSSEGKAEIRPVVAGAWVGQDWVIEQGLNPGEKVITDGFMRLAPGMPVKVVDAPVAGATKNSPSQSTKK